MAAVGLSSGSTGSEINLWHGPASEGYEPPQSFKLAKALGRDEHGGVVLPVIKMDPRGEGLIIESISEIDPDLIKVAMLFVDRLDLPCNNMIQFHYKLQDDVSQVGLGDNSQAIFSRGFNYDQASGFAWEVFCQLDKREPGLWSLWQEPDTNIIPDIDLAPDMAFQIGINECLLVPSPDLPFEDVLEFKERHRNELTDLRLYLEELAIKIAREGDVRLANLEVKRFDAALANYTNSARKSNIKKAIATLMPEMDWSASVRGLINGGGAAILSAAGSLSLGATALAIGGGLLTGLTVKSTPGSKTAVPPHLRYLARIEREYGG